ncbi:M48 family metallopeptidase [Acinetobacter schindleri]|uniref:M48 family metallopeptidase n=1 Tax=Acinetobacter schindleri TaxID=108981 RepID=UPI00289825B1|nr:M48 family metallopeptidase [Acinetobacter schindleri]
MSAQVTDVIFYDGIISKPQPAQVSRIDDQSVLIRYGEAYAQQRRYLYADMQLIGALGKIQPVVELKDDARLEFSSELPEWFNLQRKGLQHSIWKLERTPALILFSVAFVLVLGFATIKWGIPAASYRVAHHLPANTLTRMGDEAESYVFKMTEDTKLPKARQQAIVAQYQQLVAGDQPAKVVFRQGGAIGANALAIPNNTIILTDELVALAQDDREIMGVLAHEQGHLVQRHSLQQALSSLGFSVILIMITGDGSDLLTNLPVAMVGASYSRNFEAEADDYALNAMQAQHIPTIHFANFLERLAKDSGEDKEAESSVWDFFSSHPATQERIKAVKAFEAEHTLRQP